MPSTSSIFDDWRMRPAEPTFPAESRQKRAAIFGRPSESPMNVFSRFGSGNVPLFEGSVVSAASREGSLTWPVTLWMTQLFLGVLNVPYQVLRAQVSTELKANAAQEFNGPQSNVQVLLVTYAVGSLGLNLHKPKSGRRTKVRRRIPFEGGFPRRGAPYWQ